MRRKYSSDREKLLKFEAEGREFAKILRSPEQFIQTVKGQNNIVGFHTGYIEVFMQGKCGHNTETTFDIK